MLVAADTYIYVFIFLIWPLPLLVCEVFPVEETRLGWLSAAVHVASPIYRVFHYTFFFFLMGVHKMLLYKDVQLYVECFIYLDE